MKPTQTIQKMIFADQEVGAWHVGEPQHLAGSGSCGQAVEMQPREQAPDDLAGEDRHDESPGENHGCRDEPRHEQHEGG